MNKAISQKTKGKLSKKELKQDKLVELTYKMEHWYYKYQKWVLSIAGAILVIVVAAFLINRTVKGNRIEQSYQLTMAKMQYSAEQLDAAQEAFRRLVSSAGGTMAGEAKYFLGRIAFEQNNFSQAADEFSGYLKDYSGSPELDCAALGGLAASYEAMGKTEDAVKTYVKIAEDYPKDVFAPQALFEASRIYIKLNQNDAALKVLRQIRDNYRESTIVAQAQKQIDVLE